MKVGSEKLEVWSLESGVSSVKREMCSVKYVVGSVKCKVKSGVWKGWRLKCGVCSVKCQVSSVTFYVSSFKCQVSSLSIKYDLYIIKCEV